MIAKVLVDLNVKEVDRLFDYKITEEQVDNIEVGMRVLVPFGIGDRPILAFVMELSEESTFDNLKTIIEILDITPTINEEQFKYIKFLNNTNYRLNIEIIKTILPKELFLTYFQTLTIVNEKNLSSELKQLFNNKKTIKYTKRLNEYQKEIKKLIIDGSLLVKKEYEQKGRHKIVKVLTYNEKNNYNRISNYYQLINFIVENPNLTKSEVALEGYSISSINTLLKHNVFILEEQIRLRKVTFKKTDLIPTHQLNFEQEIAFNVIKQSFGTNETLLLYGITGSGKTEVYMHVIKEMLKQNKNVLYLVPEIALVAQTVRYLNSRFNVSITHYNSSLSQGERFDAWYKISENEAQIIVGTRSSAFLPIKNLGIIIVDEEHDKAYDQNDNVQYNLLDILNIKKSYFNIPLLLGSATPKITTMYQAKQGNMKLLQLTKRATNQVEPQIIYANMKAELKLGNTSIFSNILKTKILERLKNKEQIILLYNRKGYSSFVLCRSCGYVPKCPSCDVSLTYYKEDNLLKCSQCNYQIPNLTKCPSCQSDKINTIGMGVEQIYEKVVLEFPEARVLRMDSDVTKYKGKHEEIWLQFKNYEADILIGTQMVSKGLDFPKVTLVGILMADLELKSPSYLASEHTYSLLTQMVGRSGRTLLGEAVIQGYDLDNFAIKRVNESYFNFYSEALSYREMAKYPPFVNISQIVISNESYLNAYQDALLIKRLLEKSNNIVLGPTEPILKYLKNLYRFVITIKSEQIDYQNIFKVLNEFTNSKLTFYNSLEVI